MTGIPRVAVAAALLALPAAAECPSDAAVAALATALQQSRPAEPYPGLVMADAQCAQDKLVRALVPGFGRPVGYKVGLTNPAAQQRFGVPHPITGVIYESTVRLRSGGEVPARAGSVLQVEADLLVRVRDEAIAAARTPEEVLRHLDQIVPFIEMPDLVLASGMDGPNLLAINVGARLGVVGEPITPTPEMAARLGSMTVTLNDDTREVARAPGSILLGHPLNVIPWLVQDLASRGQRLRAGDLVSLGGFSPAVPAQAGRTYNVRYDGLLAEPVTVSVAVR